MKKVIRCGVFETNSSATHSLIILSEADHERWMNEDLYAVKEYFSFTWKDGAKKPEKCKLYTKEEVLEMLAENGNGYIEDEGYESEEDFIKDEGFITYEDWCELELEMDTTNFTTPSGEKMVVESAYGYDY